MEMINKEGFVQDSDNLKFLSSVGEDKYYLFTPSLRRLFPVSGNMREMTIKQKGRFLQLLIAGYKVYISTTLDDEVKGSIVYSRGGSYRFPFSTKNDLIDGPSFTVPKFRGQGVAVRLGDIVMNQFEKDYDIVYGTIAKDNIASLKRCEKNGFEVAGYVTYNRWKRAVIDENGEMVLVAYKRIKAEKNKEP